MSEWQDMRNLPNTELQDLRASKKAKTRTLSEFSKTEQNRWVKLNALLDERRRKKNVLPGSRKNQYTAYIKKTGAICMQ